MSWPSCSDLSFQSKLYPPRAFTLSTAQGIGDILSFNLLSEEWYAVTSPVTNKLPFMVVPPPIIVVPFAFTWKANLSYVLFE